MVTIIFLLLWLLSLLHALPLLPYLSCCLPYVHVLPTLIHVLSIWLLIWHVKVRQLLRILNLKLFWFFLILSLLFLCHLELELVAWWIRTNSQPRDEIDSLRVESTELTELLV